MNGRVVRHPRALEDISEQARYIADDNPAAAERFVEAAEQAFAMLADMPGMGTPRDYGRIEGLRMWPVRGFQRHLIFYRPIEGGIEVVRVLHASRDLEALFEGE